ncbi:MAG: hypothetical protein P8Y24_01815 [Gammaproteobacteria bacterium]
MMWYAANLAHAVEDANDFGIPVQREKTDWQQLVSGCENYISNINSYWNDYVDKIGIDHTQG